MIILGIETSCDETAVSVVEANGNLLAQRSLGEVGDDLSFKLLGSAINSQIEIHKQYGGVFPTLAKREHQKNLPLVLAQALKEAGFGNELWDTPKQDESATGQVNYELWKKKNQNKKFPIDAIVVTVGPGLEPALWTGINFGEKLGKSWGIPVIGANHMEGHMASVLLSKAEEIKNSKLQITNKKLEFPAIALLISGGHTELIYLKNWAKKQKIGETKDDAVGEAFDKVARMLGLPYPGGPEISKLAEEARSKNILLETKFPRPMIHSKDFNFSFSGLKTAVLYYIKKITQESKISREQKLAIAREFEDAVIETLISKTRKAIDEYNPKTLIIGGGVIANKALRENFMELKKYYQDLEISIPEKSLTTDNATMIAVAGYIEYLNGEKLELKANGNLSIN